MSAARQEILVLQGREDVKGVEMLEIVAGENGVDTFCLDLRHIDHGADDVRLNSWIDI